MTTKERARPREEARSKKPRHSNHTRRRGIDDPRRVYIATTYRVNREALALLTATVWPMFPDATVYAAAVGAGSFTRVLAKVDLIIIACDHHGEVDDRVLVLVEEAAGAGRPVQWLTPDGELYDGFTLIRQPTEYTRSGYPYPRMYRIQADPDEARCAPSRPKANLIRPPAKRHAEGRQTPSSGPGGRV